MTTDVQPVTTPEPVVTQPTTQASAAAVETSEEFSNFLTLLTTQVENQDPLEPLDSTQFVEQLATFSALEQQVETNDLLQQILTKIEGA